MTLRICIWGGLFLLFVHASAWAASDTTPIDPSLCQALTKHVPDANVTYRPGVDVHGKPVAPADLSGGAEMQLPSKLTIPLTINLAKALNVDTTQYPYNQLGAGTEAKLGTITVDGDHVLFNGKEISNSQQDNLAVLCMKANKAN